MKKRKFSFSIYIIALSFSYFIAACCGSLIYKLSMPLCEIIYEGQRECIINSTEILFHAIIFLLSSLFYIILSFQLQKKVSRNTESVLSTIAWLFFCFLSGTGMALLMVALLNYLLHVDSWLIKIYQYIHNEWGWFRREEEENPIEGIIACFSVFICPLVFTFIFYRKIKNIISFFQEKNKIENP